MYFRLGVPNVHYYHHIISSSSGIKSSQQEVFPPAGLRRTLCGVPFRSRGVKGCPRPTQPYGVFHYGCSLSLIRPADHGTCIVYWAWASCNPDTGPLYNRARLRDSCRVLLLVKSRAVFACRWLCTEGLVQSRVSDSRDR